jgi:protein TonB
MLPENILRSDVLDIIFEYRNKTYGAYELRKNYQNRLSRAMAGVLILVVVLILMNQWKPRPVLASTIILTNDSMINIKPVEPPKPEDPPPPKEQPKPVATVDFQTIKIVPDELVRDTIPTIDDVENAVVSNINSTGNAIGDVLIKPQEPATETITTATEPAEALPSVLIHAEKMPLYPGGIENFKRYMLRNLAQPDDIEEGQKIVVIAKFIVRADGTIDEATIAKTGRADLDKEVLRVIRKMPSWEPGMQNGRAVAVWFQLPVTFVSEEN